MVVSLEAMLLGLWAILIESIPGVVGATLTLVIGFIIGKIAGKIVKEILVRSNVDSYVSKTDHLNIELSKIGALVTKWIIYLVFIEQAFLFLGVTAITDFIGVVVAYISQVIFASVAILIGYSLAVYFKDKIVTSRTLYSDIVGKTVFFLIVYLSIAIGLKFITVLNTTIIDYLLLIIVASVGLGLAIALGLGLKDVVAAAASDFVKKKTIKAVRKK